MKKCFSNVERPEKSWQQVEYTLFRDLHPLVCIKINLQHFLGTHTYMAYDARESIHTYRLLVKPTKLAIQFEKMTIPKLRV